MEESRAPCHVPWPASWLQLVSDIRGLERPTAWEVFSGMAVLTAEFVELGMTCAPPIDVAPNPEFDLLNASFLAVMVGILLSHLIDFMHVAPPCASFSIALNGWPASRVRTLESPEGLENLTAKQAFQVRIGNALAEAAATLIQAQNDAGNLFQLEQPAQSLMIEFGPMKTTR